MLSATSNTFHHHPPPHTGGFYQYTAAQPLPPYYLPPPPPISFYDLQPTPFIINIPHHEIAFGVIIHPVGRYDVYQQDESLIVSVNDRRRTAGYDDDVHDNSRRGPRNRNPRNPNHHQRQHINFNLIIPPPTNIYHHQQDESNLTVLMNDLPPRRSRTSNNVNNHGRRRRGYDHHHDNSRRGPRNRNPNHHQTQRQQHMAMIGQSTNDDQDQGRLSEETIVKHLRTRHVGPDYDQDKICVVCQDGLLEEGNEEIATLHCGHDYHPECIKNWLFHNNVCPICKSTGIYSD